jgi:hypothetical protein
LRRAWLTPREQDGPGHPARESFAQLHIAVSLKEEREPTSFQRHDFKLYRTRLQHTERFTSDRRLHLSPRRGLFGRVDGALTWCDHHGQVPLVGSSGV